MYFNYTIIRILTLMNGPKVEEIARFAALVKLHHMLETPHREKI